MKPTSAGRIIGGFVLALGILVAATSLSFYNTSKPTEARVRLAHFIITGQEPYLDAYKSALHSIDWDLNQCHQADRRVLVST